MHTNCRRLVFLVYKYFVPQLRSMLINQSVLSSLFSSLCVCVYSIRDVYIEKYTDYVYILIKRHWSGYWFERAMTFVFISTTFLNGCQISERNEEIFSVKAFNLNCINTHCTHRWVKEEKRNNNKNAFEIVLGKINFWKNMCGRKVHKQRF